jgi:hypothetical protein
VSAGLEEPVYVVHLGSRGMPRRFWNSEVQFSQKHDTGCCPVPDEPTPHPAAPFVCDVIKLSTYAYVVRLAFSRQAFKSKIFAVCKTL